MAVRGIEAGLTKLLLPFRFVRMRLLPFHFPGAAAGEFRNASQRFFVKAERFAHIANGRPAAIRDHIRGHGRAQFSVALIDVLNGELTIVTAGQIEIDVRPFAALFG